MSNQADLLNAKIEEIKKEIDDLGKRHQYKSIIHSSYINVKKLVTKGNNERQAQIFDHIDKLQKLLTSAQILILLPNIFDEFPFFNSQDNEENTEQIQNNQKRIEDLFEELLLISSTILSDLNWLNNDEFMSYVFNIINEVNQFAELVGGEKQIFHISEQVEEVEEEDSDELFLENL